MDSTHRLQPIHGPYQLTHEHIEASSTLDETDIGQWALLITGCVHMFESYEDAKQRKRELERHTRNDV